jgi:L-malate glycosyltransferase
MKRNKRIFAFHLLNDRSGSPKVLSQLIRGWVREGRDVHLYTSLHTDGFLSNLRGVHYHKGWYRFQANPWLRLLYYTLSQCILFISMFGHLRKGDIVYINTVLPFGAAWLGKLKGCRVIYHIHESTVRPAVLKWFLFQTVRSTATHIINVSEFVQKAHGVNTAPNYLVYNAIDDDFLIQAGRVVKTGNPSRVLMVCSLKAYKGVFEFLQLAHDHPACHFHLVLNASAAAIDAFFAGHKIPSNLVLFPAQKNLHPFYQWADVVLNLSRPDGWVETFGLTIIEGMAYGLPAIVPPVGGILEVIEAGVSGFSVDSRDREQLNFCLRALMEDTALYRAASDAAQERLALFREEKLRMAVGSVLELA